MEKENKNANRDRTNAGINYQDGGHHEGQQNNTTPVSGQPSSHNTTSSISEMNEGQKGLKHDDGIAGTGTSRTHQDKP